MEKTVKLEMTREESKQLYALLITLTHELPGYEADENPEIEQVMAKLGAARRETK